MKECNDPVKCEYVSEMFGNRKFDAKPVTENKLNSRGKFEFG